jgi:antitoxin (DNA-binding transcriptional repressor) of toxin-antitoxin stability system
MANPIGAYDAKTRLPELLRQVREGSRFTITHRGEAVAELCPPRATAGAEDAREAIERFEAFIREHPVKGGVDVKAIIDEGRA